MGNENLDRLISRAAEAQRKGEFASAKELAEAALACEPASVPAKFLLGVSYARLNQPHQAATLLEQVLVADPSAYEVLVSLGTIYGDIGKWELATELNRRAVSFRPRDPQAHNGLGRSLLGARRLDEAAEAFLHAIKLNPSYAAAFYNLGKTRQLQGLDGKAAEAFAQAASLAPTLENLLAFGQMLLTLCDFDRALECARHCVSRYPDSAAAHLLLCGALTETGAAEEARAQLLRAVALDPESNEALQFAVRQRPLGFIAEANDNLRLAIERNPRLVSAYDALMQNQRVTESDRALVDRMSALLDEAPLSQTELVSVHYGLGKAREDLGEFEASMRHYDRANEITRRIKFGDVPFDRDRYAHRIERMIEAFTQLSSRPVGQSESDLPVLIVGMMRSGTSLAEQILSSHPLVEGAGEQLFWSRNWERAVPIHETDAEPAARLGDEYVSELRKLFPNSPKRIVDKMPGNYMFASLIHAALPRSRMIHIRRNPADTCLSIWATPNHQPHEGGHDKGDIAFVYQQYLRVMEHWRGVLPPDRFLEIDYESLVAAPEEIVPRLIEFCELEWNEACLRPQDNDRLVATPSAWQVRQPMYRTSVARWKRFEPWLGEFRELLALSHPPLGVGPLHVD